LREEIVEFTQERQREGVSVKTTAGELGMSESGLRRWLQKADGRLRPVRVIEKSSIRELVLVTPGGYRLEGLSSSSAVEVLRRLGC
jgi:transposase-like protein